MLDFGLDIEISTGILEQLTKKRQRQDSNLQSQERQMFSKHTDDTVTAAKGYEQKGVGLKDMHP